MGKKDKNDQEMKKIIAILFMVFSLEVLAQTSAYHHSFYEVNVNSTTFSERAHIFTTEKKIKARPNLIYFWYYSNKILQTQGGYDGKLLHGEYTCFYLNNNLKEKGDFKKGLKNGTWISWFENGKVEAVRNWKAGQLEGKSQSYDLNGNMTDETSYHNNILHGTKKIYKDGKLTSEKRYKNGDPVSEKKPLRLRNHFIKKKTGDNDVHVKGTKKIEKEKKYNKEDKEVLKEKKKTKPNEKIEFKK